MKESKSKKQMQQFLGSANFCSKMQEHWSYLLAMLTELMGNILFKLESKYCKSFEEIKAVMTNEVML